MAENILDIQFSPISRAILARSKEVQEINHHIYKQSNLGENIANGEQAIKELFSTPG
jgi:hypothetical protein